MYLATFVDDYSSLSVVCPIKAKSDVAGVTIDVINMLEKQSGWPLLVVRSDNGSEYINSTLSTFFKEKGVLCQTTVRYTPEQNGKAERLNRNAAGPGASHAGGLGAAEDTVGGGGHHG